MKIYVLYGYNMPRMELTVLITSMELEFLGSVSNTFLSIYGSVLNFPSLACNEVSSVFVGRC